MLMKSRVIKHVGEYLRVLIDKEQALESLPVLLKPFMLNALFCRRSIFWRHLKHPEKKMLAFSADPTYFHLYIREGVLVLVRKKHLLSVSSLVETIRRQEIVHEAPNAENIRLKRKGVPLQYFRAHITRGATF
jgi:hypothetical protein